MLPSRTEGMPLILLEALAVGAPIIATRCSSGVEQLLEAGRYGELVPPGSVDALASAIRTHLREPADLRARAAEGPTRALDFRRLELRPGRAHDPRGADGRGGRRRTAANAAESGRTAR